MQYLRVSRPSGLTLEKTNSSIYVTACLHLSLCHVSSYFIVSTVKVCLDKPYFVQIQLFTYYTINGIHSSKHIIIYQILALGVNACYLRTTILIMKIVCVVFNKRHIFLFYQIIEMITISLQLMDKMSCVELKGLSS